MSRTTEIETKDSDAELVRRVNAGDRAAFDEIDRRYRDAIGRFLLRYVRGNEEADELTQRCLIRAFEMIEQLREGEKLAGWLHRIAFRMAAAEGRRRKPVSLEALEVEVRASVVSDRLEEKEQEGNLWATARRELSDEEYHILHLRYREEWSLAEIAREIGKNEGAVRVRLHRARKKILLLFRGES